MFFNNRIWDCSVIARRANLSCKEFIDFIAPPTVINQVVKEIKWVHPEPHQVKFNSDGSLIGTTQRSGFGGLFRNHLGIWIRGFCGFFGNRSILFIELMGIKMGLIQTWAMGISTLVCESDSLEAVKLVCSTEVPVYHQYATLIADIKSLISRDWNVSISHVFRETNACADMLTHLGVDQND